MKAVNQKSKNTKEVGMKVEADNKDMKKITNEYVRKINKQAKLEKGAWIEQGRLIKEFIGQCKDTTDAALKTLADHPQCIHGIAQLRNYWKAFEVYEHFLEKEERYCYRCDGDGFDYNGVCDRCDGTGIYQEAETIVFVVFRFDVGGKTYSWHQPKRSVSFDYKTTGDASPMPELGHNRTALSNHQLDMAMILVDWFVNSPFCTLKKAA